MRRVCTDFSSVSQINAMYLYGNLFFLKVKPPISKLRALNSYYASAYSYIIVGTSGSTGSIPITFG